MAETVEFGPQTLVKIDCFWSGCKGVDAILDLYMLYGTRDGASLVQLRWSYWPLFFHQTPSRTQHKHMQWLLLAKRKLSFAVVPLKSMSERESADPLPATNIMVTSVHHSGIGIESCLLLS